MRTRLCDLLGIDVPIIQAGMGLYTDHRLVAAVSNAGALGSLGMTDRAPADARQQLAEIRERTNRPFAANFLIPWLDDETVSLALAERVPVIVTALGNPGADFVRRAHDAGAIVVHQVHTAAQASLAAERGVDVIIAQGGEAGGNSGRVATLVLVPQVVDAVRPIPVVAAGGIADGRGIAAAFILGAEGVNLGTRFLATIEAPIAEAWKQAIVGAQSEDAVQADFWNAVRQRLDYDVAIRAIRTPFSDHWSAHRDEFVTNADQYTAEVAAATPARMHAYFPMAGQTVGLIGTVASVEDVVRQLVAEATAALRQAPALVD